MSKKKRSILFVMPQLGGGGAERVISTLLNNLDRELYTPKLLIFKEHGSNAYLADLKSDIEIDSLGIKLSIKYSFITFIILLIKYIRKHKPDILFMGSGRFNALLAPFLRLIPKQTKKVARESNLPSQMEKFGFVKWLYKHYYKNYDVIIAQSDDMAEELSLNFGISRESISKINNPVDTNFINKKLDEKAESLFPQNKINLLAAGRLTYQKGFDMLIDNLAKVDANNFHLTILGTGEDEELLKDKASKLGLQNTITFKGEVKNPYLYMQQADFFVLSSRFEGFPNVLLEALICGCPIFANNCPGGINEIITPENGVIFSFGNDDFVEKLHTIEQKQYNRNGIREKGITKYDITSIMPFYNKVLY